MKVDTDYKMMFFNFLCKIEFKFLRCFFYNKIILTRHSIESIVESVVELIYLHSEYEYQYQGSEDQYL